MARIYGGEEEEGRKSNHGGKECDIVAGEMRDDDASFRVHL